jgi:hypothetical protein
MNLSRGSATVRLPHPTCHPSYAIEQGLARPIIGTGKVSLSDPALGAEEPPGPSPRDLSVV